MFSLTSPLILASRSPRRVQILEMLGFDFSVIPSDSEEIPPAGLQAPEIPEALACMKALDVSRSAPEALVLGADTLVEIDGEMLGKPADAEEALAMLKRLNGTRHRVYTGVALAKGGGILRAGTGRTEVVFARNAEADLRDYIRGGEPMDKAGAYAAQGRGAFLVDRIEGCFFNVMGLPVRKTLELLGPARSAGTSTFA